MVLLSTPVCDFNNPIKDFSLPGVDGRTWTRADCQGENGTLVMFICNHCPYVKAIVPRLVDDMKALQSMGVGCVAISANDVNDYPEDSFENMAVVAKDNGFTFPYLYDETQVVAKRYGAVCTPDFFGYNREGGLQYRGRLDASGRAPAPDDVPRDLLLAMTQVVQTGEGPREQFVSQGCSIKWKE